VIGKSADNLNPSVYSLEDYDRRIAHNGESRWKPHIALNEERIQVQTQALTAL